MLRSEINKYIEKSASSWLLTRITSWNFKTTDEAIPRELYRSHIAFVVACDNRIFTAHYQYVVRVRCLTDLGRPGSRNVYISYMYLRDRTVTSIKLLEHQIIYGSTYKDGLGLCSDSLRAGRFAVRTQVRGAIYRTPVQTAPGTHPASVQ